MALDESVDEALLQCGGGGRGGRGGGGGGGGAAAALEELMEPTFGVAALVLKPSVLGGFEACAAAAAAARSHGISAVVTTAFDSGVGTAACAHLAAALDAAAVSAAAEANASETASASAAAAAAAAGVGTHMSSSASSSSPFVTGVFDEDDDAEGGYYGYEEEGSAVGRLGAMHHGLGTGAWLAGRTRRRRVQRFTGLTYIYIYIYIYIHTRDCLFIEYPVHN